MRVYGVRRVPRAGASGDSRRGNSGEPATSCQSPGSFSGMTRRLTLPIRPDGYDGVWLAPATAGYGPDWTVGRTTRCRPSADHPPKPS